jgi:hypothetical protein
MTNDSELITIRDIDVPFWRIVMILIKWSIAAIPAAIIVALLYAVIIAILGAIGMSVLDVLGVSIPKIPMLPMPQ